MLVLLLGNASPHQTLPIKILPVLQSASQRRPYSFIQKYLLNASLFETDLFLGIPRGIRSAGSQANKQILKFSEMGATVEAFTK